MTRIRQKWLTVIVGWIFIVLGIAGLFSAGPPGRIVSNDWSDHTFQRVRVGSRRPCRSCEFAFRGSPHTSMKLPRRPVPG